MTCTLCNLTRELKRSHIVPEFLHTPIYDEKHRIRLVGQGRNRPEFLQKGIRERLLCEDCEGKLARFEDYFARRWYRNNPLGQAKIENRVVNASFDYPKLKLFLLSIVWRASVADGKTFRSADLGPHEEIIRTLLTNEDPRSSVDYPIYAGLIVDPETRMLWDNVVFPPLRFRVYGLWAYRLVFGGVSWTVVVSRHRTLKNHFCHLTEAGDLVLPCASWEVFFREMGLVEIARELTR